MSRLRSIWLVAKREVIERGRSRGFILSVLFTTGIIIASFLVPALLFGDEDVTKVGIAEPAPAGLDAAVQQSAVAFDMEVETRAYPNRAAGVAVVESGEIDGLLVVPPDLSSSGELVVDEEVDQTLRAVTSSAVISLRQATLLGEAGVPPEDFAAASTPPEDVALNPQSDADLSAFVFANIGAVLILVGVFSFGFTVLTGVVEEKQSRVVEVVLSTVRPRDLLMGKVLGIGILGLFQLAVFLIAGLVAAQLTQRFEFPATTPSAVLQLTIWFILGYALYSTALGFLGALASRMEEASNASTPVTLIAMVSYFASIFVVLDDPSGTVARILTFLPPSAPFVVPLRAALDAIEPWEIMVAIVLTVIAIWFLFVIGARVYAGAVLQTTGRTKLRDAWRAAGESS
jgi:ABC-2 type transport system permease protein